MHRVLRSACHLSASAGLLLSAPVPLAAAQPPRARDLGIPLQGQPGPLNAITDVAGVEVGHTTILRGSGPRVVGQGPVRTGVTAILPRGRAGTDEVFAAWFTLNGNGEMTGTTWVEESGQLGGPVMITNTHSVGVVQSATVEWAVKRGKAFAWSLPVVAETWDGSLNDINGFHVTREHAWQAIDAARGGPVTEGAVGGGTGMMCHEFKGGIGTASRRLPIAGTEYTVGVLVQCNYGLRRQFRLGGIPAGEAFAQPMPCYRGTMPASPEYAACPAPGEEAGRGPAREEKGSIIIIVATDAPLLPHQLKRLVKRAALGIGRMGGVASNGSGDIFLAFSTQPVIEEGPAATWPVTMFLNNRISPLFEATVQATEEAILNALVAARDMVGADDLLVPALPHEAVRAFVQRTRR
ncbi:MAG: P1 family peptidase [Gemmatimonadota bacterium]|mgnify:CR=1 FL=1